MNENDDTRYPDDEASYRGLLTSARQEAAAALKGEDGDVLLRATHRLSIAKNLVKLRENEVNAYRASERVSRHRRFWFGFSAISAALLILASVLRIPSMSVELDAKVTSVTFDLHSPWVIKEMLRGTEITISGFSVLGDSEGAFEVEHPMTGETNFTYPGDVTIEELKVMANVRLTIRQSDGALNLTVSGLLNAPQSEPLVVGYLRTANSPRGMTVISPSVEGIDKVFHTERQLYFSSQLEAQSVLVLTLKAPTNWSTQIEQAGSVIFEDASIPVLDGGRQPSSILGGTLRRPVINNSFNLNKGDFIKITDSLSTLSLSGDEFLQINRNSVVAELLYGTTGDLGSLRPTLLDWLIKQANVVQAVWGLLTLLSVLVGWFVAPQHA